MIIEKIVEFGVSIINGIISLFPTSSSSFSVNLGEYMASADQFINMPLLMSVVGFFLVYEGAIILVRSALFLWNTIKP